MPHVEHVEHFPFQFSLHSHSFYLKRVLIFLELKSLFLYNFILKNNEGRRINMPDIKKAQRKEFFHPDIQRRLKNLFLKGIGIIFFLIFSFLFLSLFSYSSFDPSYHTASAIFASNWMGENGAIVSDLLFQYLGLLSFFIPLFFFFWAWILFKSIFLFRKDVRVVLFFIGLVFFIHSFFLFLVWFFIDLGRGSRCFIKRAFTPFIKRYFFSVFSF